jgi:thiosulfate/3-mercaptopyruvate sulfurtransferase
MLDNPSRHRRFTDHQRRVAGLLIETGLRAGVPLGRDTIVYCRNGERSAHTWFVLHELLGLPNVKNYDGSWAEYGSLVGVPIAKEA